jgi:hypothetical protein
MAESGDASATQRAPGGPGADGAGPQDGPAVATRADRVLLAAFWIWAGLLLLATLAQLFGWSGVLDALDAKRWFAG